MDLTNFTDTERRYHADLVKRKNETKMSVTELARRAGLPRETVSRILHGRQRPTLVTWEKLHDAVRKVSS